MKRVSFLFAASLLSACTLEDVGKSANDGSPDPDATRVFAVEKATANTLVVAGVWEAAKPQTAGSLSSTSRFEFRESFVVAAARCTRAGSEPVVVGGRAAAALADGLIEIKQEISDTRSIGSDAACQVRASKGVLPACDPLTPPANRTACYELTGTTLDIYQGPTGIQSFLKIAD